jgi:hypothetical protein
MTAPDVVFVGGSMRTGTSLLQAVLCASPDAHPRPRECQYLTEVLMPYVSRRRQFDRFVSDYFGTRERFAAHARLIVEDFLAAARDTLAPGRTLVLKNPELTPAFPALADLLPQAKFLVSLRDPRDAIASMIVVAERQRAARQPALGDAAQRDIPALCARFRSYYAAVVRHGDKLSGRILAVRYEDLVRDTDRVVRILQDFTRLALDGFDANAPWRDLAAPDEGAAETSPTPWRSELNGRGLSPDAIGRHAEILTTEEANLVAAELSDFARSFRYSL